MFIIYKIQVEHSLWLQKYLIKKFYTNIYLFIATYSYKE